MFKKIPPFFLLCLGLAWVAGCDSQSQQDDFEDQAFGEVPSGFVQTRKETGGKCTIENEDKDDWLTSPAYETNVTVIDTPCPNPVNLSGFTTILVSISGLTPGRLSVHFLGVSGRLEQLDVIDHGGNGLYAFTVNAARLGRPGLHRLFVMDPALTLVSYGDVMVVE